MDYGTFESLGDKCKHFESKETFESFDLDLPVVMRLDGQAFHTLTRNLERPLSMPFRNCMVETTKYLVKHLHASFGYTQSDEITLGFRNMSHLFNGRKHKILSVSAGMAAAKFNQEIAERLPELKKLCPRFDCRAWNVPDLEHVAEAVMFRFLDCVRCSVNMLCSSVFSHKQLEGKAEHERFQMLKAKGIPWQDMPDFYKYGTFVQRQIFVRDLTPEELETIPEKHRPKGPIFRSEVIDMKFGNLRKIPNLVEVLFPPTMRKED